MNLLKIFLINLFILLFSFNLFSDIYLKYYRSNSNGLKLVEIKLNKKDEFKYYLKAYYSDSFETRRILYKDNKEYKRWEYKYSKGILSGEEYYKDNIIKEDYKYDNVMHIIKKNEYKNGKIIRSTNYDYNNIGLVDTERTLNALNNSITTTKYKYDINFTIKQIEKRYPDNRIVYWEAFFNSKGIVQKEFYTLKEERFIFLYNDNGQEISGEIRNLNNDTIKKEWKVFYTDKGKLDKKEESNYVIGKKTFTWYDEKNKETRIEIYKQDKIESIEKIEYNSKSKVKVYEILRGLISSKEIYDYDEKDKVIKITYLENEQLKKDVSYNNDGSRTETLYSGRNSRIIIKFDAENKKISEELF